MPLRRSALLALAAAAALPLAAQAADPLSVFQPRAVKAIAITPADERALRALPPLEAFGTLRGTRSPGLDEVGSASEAAQSAGRPLRLPGTVPANLARDAHYEITRRARTTFTFSAAKAAAWAKTHKVAFQPPPRGLDGATYTAILAPVAIVTYGTPPRGRRADRGVRRGEFLAVVQAPVPTVRAQGAPLSALSGWFARQPGLPAGLAAQVKAIGDPTQTLPIPIRFDKQTAAQVQVDGVQGLAIGDETGIGSAVVWTKGGTLYAVGGTLAQSAVLAIANDLR
ncbi:MAG: hypothetical protein QOI11_1901 [Candidatus Eremiobacteraeota bacterium]|nr:hypothetical protein [Candidatus Eremiobacteraeota bacterium]